MAKTDNNGLEIGLPDPDRPPLSANIFFVTRQGNSTLLPMFPYMSEGCMVAGASIFYSGEGRGMGAFNHKNTVDEVAICMASRGSGIRSGDVFTGAKEHLVGSFFEKEDAEDNMMVVMVVQRQAESGEQHETMSYLCEKCQAQAYSHNFSTKNGGDKEHALPGYAPPLDTLIESHVSVDAFNKNDDLRECKKCGHKSGVFPEHVWGWELYYNCYHASEDGRRVLHDYMKTIEGAN